MKEGKMSKIYLEWSYPWWAQGEGYLNFAWDKKVGKFSKNILDTVVNNTYITFFSNTLFLLEEPRVMFF